MESLPNEKSGISRGRRIWAIFVLIAGITAFLVEKAPWSIFSGCGMLLCGWAYMYYPAPGFRQTPREIYDSARTGRWTPPPKYVRTALLLSVILIIAGIVGSCSH